MSCECVESEKSVTLLLDEDQNKISFGGKSLPYKLILCLFLRFVF